MVLSVNKYWINKRLLVKLDGNIIAFDETMLKYDSSDLGNSIRSD